MRRIKEVLTNRRGDALIVVLGIMMLLTALAFTLLTAVSATTETTARSSVSDRARIMAASFGERLTADLEKESSELKTYINQELLSQSWAMQTAPGAASGRTLQLAADAAELGGYTVTVAAAWQGPAGRPYEQPADFLNAELYLTVTAAKAAESYAFTTRFKVVDEQLSWRKEVVR